MKKISVSIAIPTYNGGRLWSEAASNIKRAANKANVKKIIIIDSGSKDDTVAIAKKNDIEVFSIASQDFNHGKTRNMAVGLCNSDITVFFTQDAIPAENAIINLLEAFRDEQVAVAYGRQLPHVDANPIAKHARFFNYSDKSYVADVTSISKLGIKTVFVSNSFAAYRTSLFEKLGGFPSNTILCEDMYYTAKAVSAEYKVAYVSDACVRHSHNYNPIEEFKRYFDIGVFHEDERWIRLKFGGAGGEGKKFLISELRFLLKNAPFWIIIASINNFSKILGYKLGLKYTYLPSIVIKKISMHTRYWQKNSVKLNEFFKKYK